MLKAKKLAVMILGTLALLGGSIQKNVQAKAIEETDNVSFAVAGTYTRQYTGESQNWDLNNIDYMYHDNTDNCYRMTFDNNLKVGDEFRILWKTSFTDWSLENSFGYDEAYVDEETSKYFTKADDSDNFKVLAEGEYDFVVKDGTTTPYASRFTIKKVFRRCVNFYLPQLEEKMEEFLEIKDGLLESSDKIIGDPVYTQYLEYDEAQWLEEIGFPLSGRFAGWFKEATFETPFTYGTILEDGEEALNLYGYFDDSTDYTFYVNDTNSVFGSTPYVYFKRQFDNHRKIDWPGEPLTKNENGYYEITIDVSYGYDMMIINNGASEQDTAVQSVIFDAKTASDQEIYLIGTQNEDKTYNIIAPEYAMINYYDGETLLGSEKKLKNINVQPTFFEKEGYRLLGWYLEPTFETLFTNSVITEDTLNLYAKYEEAEDFELYIDFYYENWAGGNVAVHRWSSNFDNPYATDINNLPDDVVQITDKFYKFTFDASKSFDQLKIKVNDDFTLTINYNQYMKGSFNIYTGSDEGLRAIFLPETIQAHIKNEEVKIPVYYPMEGKNMDAPVPGFTKGKVASTTGVSRITYENGNIVFNTDGITEEQRKNAIITYFKDREAGYWCDKSANYLEYQILANGYENEIIDEEAGTTIGDRVNYLTALAQKTNNNSQSARFNNASITNNNASFVILVVALGFISIIGYYFFNKRKLEI